MSEAPHELRDTIPTFGEDDDAAVEQGPILLRDLLGANLKVVSGYKGTADVRLAIESGELDGFLNSWESTKITSLDKVKSGEWLILAQLGDNPISELPATNVPTIPQIAKTEEQRQLLRFGAAASYVPPSQDVMPNFFLKSSLFLH